MQKSSSFLVNAGALLLLHLFCWCMVYVCRQYILKQAKQQRTAELAA
jgi:hypothetical protein